MNLALVRSIKGYSIVPSSSYKDLMIQVKKDELSKKLGSLNCPNDMIHFVVSYNKKHYLSEEPLVLLKELQIKIVRSAEEFAKLLTLELTGCLHDSIASGDDYYEESAWEICSNGNDIQFGYHRDYSRTNGFYWEEIKIEKLPDFDIDCEYAVLKEKKTRKGDNISSEYELILYFQEV